MSEKIRIYNPKTGKKGTIDKGHLRQALEVGYLPVDPPKQPNPNKEQWGKLATDAAEKGALNTLDLPQNIAGLAEGASNLVGGAAANLGLGGWHTDAIPNEGYLSNKAKELLKSAGYNLENYKPKTTKGKIIHGALEGASEAAGGVGLGAGLGGIAKIANRLKLARSGKALDTGAKVIGKPVSTADAATQAGIGASVGGGASSLEAAGVDPMSAGLIAGVGAPLAVLSGKGMKNILSKNRQEKKVVDNLKQQVGDIELKNPNEMLEGYNPTTAELYNNVGLSQIQQAMVNSPQLANKQAKNNQAVLNKINSLGNVVNDKYSAGEKLRLPFAEKYKKSLKNRSEQTKELYDRLAADTTKSKYPVISAALEGKIEQLGPDYRKGLEKYHRDIHNQDFIPIKLENTIKEMDDKISSAMRSGNRSEAKLYQEMKEVYVGELEKISPVGLSHRQKYRELSAEPNKYERNPLLHNIVKENTDINKAAGYTVSNERIFDQITSANVNDTKALVDEAKGNPELRELIKGAYIKKMLDKATTNGVDALGNPQLSYHQMTKFVKDNRSKISRFLNKEEKADIKSIIEATKMKQRAAVQGKGIGSDTYQKFKVGEEKDLADSIFSHYLPHAAGSGIGGALGGVFGGPLGAGAGGVLGGVLGHKVANKIGKASKAERKAVLDRAMTEPLYFNEIMSKKYPTNIYRPLVPLNIGMNREKQK